MSERRIVNTNIRLNLDRPEDRRAWEYLQSLDRKKYRSYSRAVVAAVNDHFSREERLEADPYLETREKEDAFLGKVLDTIREGMQSSGGLTLTGLAALIQAQGISPTPLPEQKAMSDEDLDTAMEFIDSL